MRISHLSLVCLALISILSCHNSQYHLSRGISNNPVHDSLSHLIKILEIGSHSCIIFPKEAGLSFDHGRFLDRFTPTEDEILEVEKQIQDQYLESRLRFIYNQVFYRTDVYGKQDFDKVGEFENLMEYAIADARLLDKYDRQYLGFIEDGQKILIIQYLNFTDDPYNLKIVSRTQFINGWHGWFSSNTQKDEFNMNTNRLNAFGWSHL